MITKYKGKILGAIAGLILTQNLWGAIFLSIVGHFLYDYLNENNQKKKKSVKLNLDNEIYNNYEILPTHNNLVFSIIFLTIELINLKKNSILSEIEIIKDFFKTQFYFDSNELFFINDIINNYPDNNHHANIIESINIINQFCKYNDKLNIIHLLFAVAVSDMPLNEKENKYIFEISQKLNINFSDFNNLKNNFIKNNINHYEILGIPPNSTLNEIKTAYRNLIKEFHPDKNNSNYDKEKFQQIIDSYNELLKQYKE